MGSNSHDGFGGCLNLSIHQPCNEVASPPASLDMSVDLVTKTSNEQDTFGFPILSL